MPRDRCWYRHCEARGQSVLKQSSAAFAGKDVSRADQAVRGISSGRKVAAARLVARLATTGMNHASDAS
jgi:hypothetical protein